MSISQEVLCPSTHPYAYDSGQQCCETNFEKPAFPPVAACDGSEIHLGGVESTCCADDTHTSCSEPPCSSYVVAPVPFSPFGWMSKGYRSYRRSHYLEK